MDGNLVRAVRARRRLHSPPAAGSPSPGFPRMRRGDGRARSPGGPARRRPAGARPQRQRQLRIRALLGGRILAALDSVLGAVRAELDGGYDNRIFISGFITNAIVAVLLTFIGDRLGLDLYLVALLTFGLRIFQNVALIRRHFLARPAAQRQRGTTRGDAKRSWSAIDVGTTKVCALIGEVSRDGGLTIIGKGPRRRRVSRRASSSTSTRRSFDRERGRAGRAPLGLEIEPAFVGVGGQPRREPQFARRGRRERPQSRGEREDVNGPRRWRARCRSRRTATCSTSCPAGSSSTARRA